MSGHPDGSGRLPGKFDPLAKAAKDGWGVVVYSFLCFSHS